MADLVLGAVVDASTHQRTTQPVAIATADLTTHGVIVGMTGSGKTGLALVLIEEVLSAGVPCILIDPKGDLADLCLLFPNLAPGDFRPWINDGDAARAGVFPDESPPSRLRHGRTVWPIGASLLSASASCAHPSTSRSTHPVRPQVCH